MFKTFEGKIIGMPVKSEVGKPMFASLVLTFSKNRIMVKENQEGRFQLKFNKGNLTYGTQYIFSKEYNEHDKKVYTITIDSDRYFIHLSYWNKFKANIVHNRYWISREKEWFVKTIIATAVGALFALMGGYVGYKLGIQSQQTPKTTVQPNKTQQVGR